MSKDRGHERDVTPAQLMATRTEGFKGSKMLLETTPGGPVGIDYSKIEERIMGMLHGPGLPETKNENIEAAFRHQIEHSMIVWLAFISDGLFNKDRIDEEGCGAFFGAVKALAHNV